MAMRDDDRRKLRIYRTFILDDVKFGDVKDHLVSCDTLSLKDMEDIDSWRTPHEKMSALLDLLPRRGAKAYPSFCAALNEQYPWIVEELNKTVVHPVVKKRVRVIPDKELNHSVLTMVDNSNAIKNYKSIVRSLGLTEADIYQEEHANQGNPKEQFYQCLVKWLNKSGRSATAEIFMEAVRKADCPRIAGHICQGPIWSIENKPRHLMSSMMGYMLTSKTEATVKTYTLSFRRWEKFAVKYSFRVLPASVVHFGLYLTFLADTTRSVAATKSAAYGVNFAHTINDLSSPTNSKFIRKLLHSIARRWAKPVKRVDPISSEYLNTICEKYSDSTDLNICRDVCLMIFNCFLSFNQVSQLMPSDITINDDCIQINLQKIETDQFRKGRHISIDVSGDKSCILFWLNKYMYLASINLHGNDFLFKLICSSHGKKGLINAVKPMSYSSVRRCVNKISGSVRSYCKDRCSFYEGKGTLDA